MTRFKKLIPIFIVTIFLASLAALLYIPPNDMEIFGMTAYGRIYSISRQEYRAILAEAPRLGSSAGFQKLKYYPGFNVTLPAQNILVLCLYSGPTGQYNSLIEECKNKEVDVSYLPTNTSKAGDFTISGPITIKKEDRQL